MRDFTDVLKETTSRMLASRGAFNGHGEPGYSQVQAQHSEKYMRNLMEAARLTDRVLRGDRFAALQFQEALTTSDFAAYFGDILDRQVLANYQETPYTWSTYCKSSKIRDFRQAKRFRFDRGASVLNGPIVPNDYGASGSGPTGLAEVTEYPERKRVSSAYDLQLYKYGARMPFSWETMINDDLDALKNTPALFGQASRRTEEQLVTQLYMSSTGPNSTFFSTANLNVVTAAVNSVVTTDNPPLSIEALRWAMIIAASQLDLDGMPIGIDGWTLVVPPALDITARNIINATQIWLNEAGGVQGLYGSGATANAASLQRLITENWAKGMIKPVVNYFAPLVNTTSGQTAWYLFANPSTGRPAMEMGFLMGHEKPEMFMKLPNQTRIGEGSLNGSATPGTNNMNPMEGDFDTDSIHYKVRHVLGGTLLDPKMGVASNGTGS